MGLKTVITQAQVGTYLYVPTGRCAGVCQVINRFSKRGRKGFTKICVKFGDNSEFWIKNDGTVDRSPFMFYAICKATLAQIEAFKRATKPQQTPPKSTTPVFIYSDKLKVSSNIMLFFRYSNLKAFPCSPQELKVARTKAYLALHPDQNHTPTANEDFISVQRAYDELLKQI